MIAARILRCLCRGMVLVWVAGAFGVRQPAAAAEGSDAVRLERLAADFWELYLRSEPVEATALGDRRFDHLLTDITPAGRTRLRQQLDALHQSVAALDLAPLSAEERITASMLLEVIAGNLANLDCGFYDWVVDPLEGPQVAFQNVPAMQRVDTPEQARAMGRRWRAMGPAVDAHIANLRAGLANGRVATRNQVERVLEELDEQLAQDVREWALLSPLETPHPDWPVAERQAFTDSLTGAVRELIRPAFVRYRDFLRAEILPRARAEDKVGLVNLPGGDECYAAMIRRHTTLALTADQIHTFGRAEVERIMTEMRILGERVFKTYDQAEILKRLRSDPKLHFATRDEVEAKAREALTRAQAAVPRAFGIRPRAGCEVVRMESHEEKHSTIAYYRQPAVDGSRPGRYYINTSEPETRPRYEAEALAFHEAVPGHHLQIAIAQEIEGIPAFRKHLGATAFVEGWALYTEQLCDELGLYSSDLDRMGKLSFEAWRACRLVVDTGMHAQGWSRQQAIDFMLANSALAENNIVNEVDRYITWPGQALAYKLGQVEILELREEAKRLRGTSFDLREFHDVVLSHGAVTMTALGDIVRDHFSRPAPAAKGGR
ncbi:MAG TPA: DUF885 domain-containing protein [Candidatus Krumholzibacteria bacterium]|nr:DUF885 domain-containing protein [Candidatus Krumholzibacteria bacterium]